MANANTEGFSRQTCCLELAAHERGLQLGNGVGADQVVRSVDKLLVRPHRPADLHLSRLDAQLVEMQASRRSNEPGGDGFGGLLDGIFSMSALSANTEDIVNRTGVIQSGEPAGPLPPGGERGLPAPA